MKIQKSFLHLLLVSGVLMYLYSPFLDHWSGKEVYARPHTHISLSFNPDTALHETGFLGDAHQHEHHDEGVLCVLDIDALLALLLVFNPAPEMVLVPDNLLFSELSPFYLDVSIIYLASLDPPPTF